MRSMLLLAATLGLSACGSSDQSRAATNTQSEDPDFAAARDYITQTSRDPDSAKFGSMTRGKPGFICGTVNAKNAFGGYTGPRAFAFPVARPSDLLIYDYDSGALHDWDKKGDIAVIFEERGCSVGPDHKRALEAHAAMKASDERIRNWSE